MNFLSATPTLSTPASQAELMVCGLGQIKHLGSALKAQSRTQKSLVKVFSIGLGQDTPESSCKGLF